MFNSSPLTQDYFHDNLKPLCEDGANAGGGSGSNEETCPNSRQTRPFLPLEKKNYKFFLSGWPIFFFKYQTFLLFAVEN